MEIFRLFGSIFVENDQATRDLNTMNAAVDNAGSKFTAMIGTVAKWGVAVAAGAAAAGVGLFALAQKTSDYGSDIVDLSAKIGMSTDGFQEWKFILENAGVEMSVLQSGFKSFNNVIDAANQGGKTQIAMFSELGVSLTDVGGKAKSTEQLFNESAKALMAMPEGSHKAALANDLFGKSSTELAAILNGTTKEFEDAKKQARDLGLVVGETALKQMDNFGDTATTVKKTIGAFGLIIGMELIPTFQKMMDWVISNMPQIRAVFNEALTTVKNITKDVINIFKEEFLPIIIQLYEYIKTNWPQIKQFFNTSFGIMKVVLEGIVTVIGTAIKITAKYWGVLEPLFLGVAAGILTFKAIILVQAAWTAGTVLLTTATTAFAAVLAFITSPIGIVVLAIAGLVAAGVALYKNWDTVKAFAISVWGAIKDYFVWFWEETKRIYGGAWEWVKNFFMIVFNPIGFIIANFDAIKTYFLNFVEPVVAAFTNIQTRVVAIWNNIVWGIKSAINTVISPINKFINATNGAVAKLNIVPGVNLPSIPNIPMLAEGGTITRRGSVIVGENAPEILDLPAGARVTPLNKASGGGITVNINSPNLFNDKDADKLGDLIVTRLRVLGVK